MQPIAAADVAAATADVALAAPANGTIEIAGPEPVRLGELVGRFLSAANDPREVIADHDAPYHGVRLDDRSLMPGANPRLGSTRCDDWLDNHTPRI